MKRALPVYFLILLLAGLAVVNGLVLRDLQDISQSGPIGHRAGEGPGLLDTRPVLRIGVVSRFAPNIIYSGYQPIMDYLNRTGSYVYELRLSTSYQDAVDRLRSGEVAASFLGAWITSSLAGEADLVPLLAPLNSDGKSEFRAVLVTGPDSDLHSLEQLRGRSVALPSDQSWSGNWLQTSGLAGVGLSLADLDSVCHFDHHQTVVWQVLRGHFDAGVVKELVAARYAREGLRPVATSAAIPGPPLVGNRNAPAAALEEITRLLLALDPADPGDREIIDSWTPEFSFGFCPVDRDSYRRAFDGSGGAP